MKNYGRIAAVWLDEYYDAFLKALVAAVALCLSQGRAKRGSVHKPYIGPEEAKQSGDICAHSGFRHALLCLFFPTLICSLDL